MNEFGTTGYTRDRVFVLYDRNSDSVWHPLSDGSLDAISGAKKGQSIPFVAKPDPMPLRQWLENHPKSLILLSAGKAPPRRAYLGVRLVENTLTINEVVAGTPAARAGLQAGDVIRQIDSESSGSMPLSNRLELRSSLGLLRASESIHVVVERAGEPVRIPVQLGNAKRSPKKRIRL